MKYRLTIYPAFDLDTGASKEFLFETLPELLAAYESCSLLLIYLQDEITVMEDYSNMFISEQLVDGEWKEIEEGDE
jgi:hypothetical protein